MSTSGSSQTCPALPGLEIDLVRGRPAHLFSVDVEEWFHSNFQSAPVLDATLLERRAHVGVTRVLEALAATGSRATFFVLGALARESPEIVKSIAAAGHEIGCHSLNHTLLYEQRREDVQRELVEARAVLQDHAGQPVFGFRAPSWSVTQKNLWALDVIAEAGFRYDSSIFPAANYLYGVSGAPTTPYRVRTPLGATLLEIPPSTIGVSGLRFGVGGGFYLRVLPLAVHELALRLTEARKAAFVAYTHPRELDPGSWSLELPLDSKERMIHGFALGRGASRIRALLALGGWQSFDTLLEPSSPTQ